MQQRPLGEYIGFALSLAVFTTILWIMLDRNLLAAGSITVGATLLGAWVKRALL